MVEIQGNISLQSQGQPQQQAYSNKDFAYESSLDEPVSVTIMRDVKKIGTKLKYVLLPRAQAENAKELRDWDLWGPLFLCLILAVILSLSDSGHSENSASLVFALVFVLVWCGSAVVTLNALLLGAQISFFQSLCVLGYCIFALDIAALLNWLVPWHMVFKLLTSIAAMVWAVFSSRGFMSQLVSPEKKALAIYPVVLFYLFLAWFILVV